MNWPYSTFNFFFFPQEDPPPLPRQQDDGWLTPVEIFWPWYAEGLLSWMLGVRDSEGMGVGGNMEGTDAAAGDGVQGAQAQPGTPAQAQPQPLRIVEVGGGTGSCAMHILDCLEREHPELYATGGKYPVDRFSLYIFER